MQPPCGAAKLRARRYQTRAPPATAARETRRRADLRIEDSYAATDGAGKRIPLSGDLQVFLGKARVEA